MTCSAQMAARSRSSEGERWGWEFVAFVASVSFVAFVRASASRVEA